MKTLNPVSLREQARQVIRASILAGELAAGEMYSASVLAARLGVSATPVREAMLDLANDGLVEAVRNRGFRVLAPDENDLDEIGALRLMLEVPSTRLVIEQATDADLAAFDDVVERIESAVENDVPGFLVADREFHLGLLELTGNRRLVRLVAQLRDQTRIVGIADLARDGRLLASAREHRFILEALKARDGDLAESLMRTHLIHTRGIWAGHSEPSTRTAAQIA